MGSAHRARVNQDLLALSLSRQPLSTGGSGEPWAGVKPRSCGKRGLKVREVLRSMEKEKER